jgi:hypothetical protein
MSWIFKDEPSTPPDPKSARTRAILFALPFALLAFVALVMFAHDEFVGGLPRQKAIATLSFIAVCGGIVALIFGINAKKMAMQAPAPESLVLETAEKTWLKRTDWAVGRIASGSRKGVLLLWIFTLFWNAASAPVIFVGLPTELHKGNYAILIALLFPIIGIGMIFYALNATLAWRKFGQSIFEMAAIPGALGGTLEGEIQVKTKLQPQHGLHLRLSCVRRTTSGSGKNRSTTEIILWQDEKWLRPDLPQTDLNATGIPIYFKLPGDQPESTPSNGDGIHWKLEASAKLRGPNFQATFDVPVFKLPETPEIPDDPTTRYQMSLDEVRQQIHSKIQANDLPEGGKEFVFPAARNPGFASAMTVFTLIFGGATALLIHLHAPILFPIVFAPISLLFVFMAFNLWFLRSRVIVTPEQLTVQKSWLGIKKERKFTAADVAGFSAQPGATAGHQAYYDLKIRLRTGDGFTAASNIGDKPEADWLVQQMSATIKKTS